MKKYKFTRNFLASVLSVSTLITSSAMANNTDISSYSYINENGETITITQDTLDSEHWNIEMLDGASPEMYKDFPMNIDKFVNDFGDLSLDFSYMKNIDDFSNVSMNITQMDNGNIIFTETLENNYLYSPVLEVDKTYLISLDETIDNNTTQYNTIVQVNKGAAEMPEYIIDGNTDNNILIASIDDIRSISSVSSDGEIIIDNRTNPYTSVKANEFSSFCQSLSQDTEYRIYTQSNDIQYSGFINGSQPDFIYDYNITVSDYESLNTPSTAMTPASILPSEVKSRATAMGFEDYSFKITDGSSSTSKYKSFIIDISDYPIENISQYDKYYLQTTIKGNVSLGVYLWLEVDDVTYPLSLSPETGSTTRTISINLRSSKYGITSDSTVILYGAVYFPNATSGYGMVCPEVTTGYQDDVTGSIHSAVQDTTAPAERPTFTEYNLNGGLDVDVFYLKSVAECYKVSIRNRSLEEQADLDNGQMCTGSKEKYINIYSARYPAGSDSTNVLSISESATYAIPRNADISVYSDGSSSINKMFAAVKGTSLYSTSVSKYQISYVVLGDDSVVEG